MSDFLSRLVARVEGEAVGLQPWVGSPYEPAPTAPEAPETLAETRTASEISDIAPPIPKAPPPPPAKARPGEESASHSAAEPVVTVETPAEDRSIDTLLPERPSEEPAAAYDAAPPPARTLHAPATDPSPAAETQPEPATVRGDSLLPERQDTAPPPRDDPPAPPDAPGGKVEPSAPEAIAAPPAPAPEKQLPETGATLLPERMDEDTTPTVVRPPRPIPKTLDEVPMEAIAEPFPAGEPKLEKRETAPASMVESRVPELPPQDEPRPRSRGRPPAAKPLARARQETRTAPPLPAGKKADERAAASDDAIRLPVRAAEKIVVRSERPVAVRTFAGPVPSPPGPMPSPETPPPADDDIHTLLPAIRGVEPAPGTPPVDGTRSLDPVPQTEVAPAVAHPELAPVVPHAEPVAVTPHPEPETVVRVHIGHIEVRAVQPPAPPPAPAPVRESLPSALDAYLEERDRRER